MGEILVYTDSQNKRTIFRMEETPLLQKRLFPPYPLPLKTSDAVKSSLKGVRGEAFFQESSPWKKS